MELTPDGMCFYWDEHTSIKTSPGKPDASTLLVGVPLIFYFTTIFFNAWILSMPSHTIPG